MRRPLLLIILSALLSATAQSQPNKPVASLPAKPAKEVLTNAAIIELTQLGLGESVIVEKIRQSECSFDTSLTGLRQLKAAKVGDAVIQAMLNPSAKSSVPQPSTPSGGGPKPPSPTAPPSAAALLDADGHAVPLPGDKGAYLWDGRKLTLLYQSPVPSVGSHFGRQMLSAAVPFVKQKYELQMIGGHAKLSFNHNQPIILVSGLGEVIPGMPSYRLLYVKTGGMLKDRRIVGNYEVGGFFGSTNMVDNEIPCEIKKIGEAVYAVVPSKPLSDGEYGLVQVPKMSEMKVDAKSVAAPPVWDFGVYVEGRPTK